MPVASNREYRRIDCAQLETRAQEDGGMIVEGYATVFDQEYELWRCPSFVLMEAIDPHAFDDADMSDTIMQYDHEGRVFARIRNKTLEIKPDDHGLHIRADLSGTDIGRQLYQEIAGGYTDRMSFGFTVETEERTEEYNHDTGETIVHRRITRVKKLYDVSAVSLPANDATEISARNLGEGYINRITEEVRARQERQREIEIANALLQIGG